MEDYSKTLNDRPWGANNESPGWSWWSWYSVVVAAAAAAAAALVAAALAASAELRALALAAGRRAAVVTVVEADLPAANALLGPAPPSLPPPRLSRTREAVLRRH